MNERIEAFLSYIGGERGLSAHTVSAYRNDLSQFAEFLQGEAARIGASGLPLHAVDRECLGGYFLTLRERGYAPATVARKIAALKSFFHYLKRAGEVLLDPTEGIESPEVKKTPPRAIGADDVRVIFEQAMRRHSPEGLRDSAMLRLIYATGMRVTELVTLDVTELSIDDARVRVVGRGGRPRELPLDELTLRDLRRYLEKARPYLVRHDPKQTALFLNHRGARLTRQGFWLIMKALVKACGLPVVVTPHTLRHSFATHRLKEGLALEQLRQLLGHASISTTQIYVQDQTPAPVPVQQGEPRPIRPVPPAHHTPDLPRRVPAAAAAGR